jgi:hypothetical protein
MEGMDAYDGQTLIMPSPIIGSWTMDNAHNELNGAPPVIMVGPNDIDISMPESETGPDGYLEPGYSGMAPTCSAEIKFSYYDSMQPLGAIMHFQLHQVGTGPASKHYFVDMHVPNGKWAIINLGLMPYVNSWGKVLFWMSHMDGTGQWTWAYEAPISVASCVGTRR